ncbi:hypothetical protein L3X38_030166 [Prunus dulcis]|uniref:Transmembrane protein n=1 Tax=Prunus dulcis TaxID=3755 RepID=A0AAD4V9R8_PRUDU|nr:hypothetical protein L3X38_030166 [Prunus dulcis]
MASSIAQISFYLLILTFFSETHFGLSLRDLKSDPNRPSTTAQSITDVHDLLPKYGLPKGLLPDNVNSYTLSEDGSFEIYLESPCYVHFDQLVYYNKNIKGKLSYGLIKDPTPLSFMLELCLRNCLLNSLRIFLYVKARPAKELMWTQSEEQNAQGTHCMEEEYSRQIFRSLLAVILCFLLLLFQVASIQVANISK